MLVKGDSVLFGADDMHFVQTFGVREAVEMVLNFRNVCCLPFLYDTYQLAAFLELQRKELFWLTRNSDGEYQQLTIPKKNGKERVLHAPSPILKSCQQKILSHILSELPVSRYATAYRRDSRLAENAAPHTGKRYLLKLDITDFFGSIRFEQVYSAAFHTRYFPKQIGVMLTTLCCRQDALPQGAPTSPALSNLVMKNFDDAMGAWCKQRGIAYTRYCDDMTFSSDRPLYVVYTKAKSMLAEMGFEVNERKTHFVTHASRQSVTGLTVNEKVSVSGEYKRKLRQEVHYALKFGLKESILHANRTDFLCDGQPDVERYYAHLIGRLQFVLQIEPDNEWFRKAFLAMRRLDLFGESDRWPPVFRRRWVDE